MCARVCERDREGEIHLIVAVNIVIIWGNKHCIAYYILER